MEFIARLRPLGALKAAKAEYTAEKRPAVWNIRYNDRRRGLANIPIQVDEGTVTGSEIVVAIQDCSKNHEDTQTEDTAEN